MAPINENSSTIFEMGANLVTSALPEEHKADMQMLGQGISKILQNRFLSQQAEDFKNNELAAFMQSTATFGQTYGTIEDPDKAVQAFMDYKNSVMLPFITSTSLKYSKNPSIMQTAQKVFEMGPQINDYIGVQGVKNDQARNAVAKQQADTDAAGTASLIKYRNWEMATKGGITPDSTPAQILKYAREWDQGAAVDKQNFSMLAERDASARANQYDPVRKMQFGDQPYGYKDPNTGAQIPGDVERSEQILQNSPKLVTDALEYGRLVRLIGAEEVDRKFPGLYDHVKPSYTGTVKTPDPVMMRGAVPEKTVLGVLLGKPASQLDYSNADEFLAKLQESRDPFFMGDQFVGAMAGAARMDGNVIKDPATDKPIEFSSDWQANRNKLKKLLTDSYKVNITNRLAADDVNSTSTRKILKKVGDAAIDHYLPQFAQQLNVQIAPPAIPAVFNPESAIPLESPGFWDQVMQGIGIL